MTARAAGKGFPTLRDYIAAIAVAKGLIVATRHASAFDAANVKDHRSWASRAMTTCHRPLVADAMLAARRSLAWAAALDVNAMGNASVAEPPDAPSRHAHYPSDRRGPAGDRPL